MTRTYAVAGSGAAADAATAALDDADLDAAGTGLDAIADADVAVVVGLAGSDGFAAANARARRSETPWLAVEIGGVGGHSVPDVDAAVAAFTPESGCFTCLRCRVAAGDPETTAEPSVARSSVRYAGALAGKRALDLLDGAVHAGTVVEVPHAERSFAPAPFCDCGTGERYGDPGREHGATPLDAAVSKAERAVDDRVGLVTEVGERETYPAPYYLATTCDTAALGGAASRGLAAGVGLDWDAAFVKAVGEGLERYCAAAYRESDFDVAKPTHPDALAPDAFVRPDDAPAVPRDDPLRFVPGVSLVDGSEALLPAEYVHFPPPAETHRPALTTGLGLGNDPVEALCSGLYETIERDATMLAWYSTFEPLELAVDDEAYATLARRAGAEGLDVTALLCTQDVDVPVIAVAVHGEDAWPRFALGSAASLDAAGAARSALCEAVQNWIELRDMGRERAADEQGAIGDYAAFPRAARDFLDADATVPLADVGPDTVPDGAAELDAVVERASAAGLDAYATDLTTRDVADVGFRAVRVLAPDAQPLFFDEAAFGARARDVPAELGFEARLDRRHHPFP
ncbi:ribosomal protein S12 methylthiotransferase accessory factor [Halarchaeum solikamskense]|uniref:YcaO-like family protein n=1 Tax=Halarchaeum nitratireducens TaxID=489913 RepID=UPI001B3A8D10|nr:YcaO-like family protein [Halarchaeum solikamskense]MBP2250606.1 ribosomal protein S12 methylthiotransferase accessory factor [Halarchaeum solikamskense]